MAGLLNLVRHSCATTGTGTLTLGSVIQGFISMFNAGGIVGVDYFYAIEADYQTVGGELVATSREVGYGTFGTSSSPDVATLTRNVLNSTNGNALLNLAGDAQVLITDLALTHREVLTAARTYYVRADGSNSNSGFFDTPGGAFMTIQHAYDVIAATLDFGAQDVTIQIGTGTFTAGLRIFAAWTGGGTLAVRGNGSTNTTISPGAGVHCFSIEAPLPGALYLGGLKLQNTSGGRCVVTSSPGYIIIDDEMNYGVSDYHIQASVPGMLIEIRASYTISGNALVHMRCAEGGSIYVNSGLTVTLTGTPAWSFAGWWCAENSTMYLLGMTFTGSATGVCFVVGSGGVIQTNGAYDIVGPPFTYPPGDAQGQGTDFSVSPWGLIT